MRSARPHVELSPLRSPFRLFGELLAIVFVVEAAGMWLIRVGLGEPAGRLAGVLDAGVLTLIVAPFVWWLVARPLRRAALNGTRWAEQVLASAVDPIITINEQGVIESANAAAARAFGYAAHQMVGRKVSMLLPAARRDEHDVFVAQEIVADEKRVIGHHREVEGRRKDGSTFPLEISVSEGQVGSLRLFTAILVDITERRRADESARRIALALSQSADSVAITDSEGSIVWVNWAFEQNSGYAREEVVGRTPRILKSGRHEPSFYEEMWSTIKAGKVFRGIFINRRKTGELYYMDQTITPIWDPDGRIAQFIASGRAISEP